MLGFNFYFSSVLQCHLEVLDKKRVSLPQVLQKFQFKWPSISKKKVRRGEEELELEINPSTPVQLPWSCRNVTWQDKDSCRPLPPCCSSYSSEAAQQEHKDTNLCPQPSQATKQPHCRQPWGISPSYHIYSVALSHPFGRCVFSLSCSLVSQEPSCTVGNTNLPLAQTK